jgi:hypothetical protein
VDSVIGMPFSRLTRVLVASARASRAVGQAVHQLGALGGRGAPPRPAVQCCAGGAHRRVDVRAGAQCGQPELLPGGRLQRPVLLGALGRHPLAVDEEAGAVQIGLLSGGSGHVASSRLSGALTGAEVRECTLQCSI